jgi:hypothetical protein
MKRFLSVAAVLSLFVALAAVAAAQDTKDKNTPTKDKPEKSQPTKEKSEKDKPPAKAPDTPKPGEEESLYYPLQDGTVWHYKIGDNRYTLKVAKHEKIGDFNCARIEQIVEERVIAVEHIAVTKDGVVRVAYDNKRAVPPLLFLKLPAKKDTTWTVDSVIGKTDKVPGEKVVGTFKAGEVTKMMVPAGTSEGVITSSTQDLNAAGQKLSFTYYFAKKVGLIKQEIDFGETKVIIELEKYDPAPSKL